MRREMKLGSKDYYYLKFGISNFRNCSFRNRSILFYYRSKDVKDLLKIILFVNKRREECICNVIR